MARKITVSRFYDLSTGDNAGNTQQEAGDYAARMIAAGATRVNVLDTHPAAFRALTTYVHPGAAGFVAAEGTPIVCYPWQDFFAGYVECVMWADGPRDDNGDEIENARGPEGRELDKLAEEAGAFFARNFARLMEARELYGMARAGHDFWLTRNGHGAGYWDRAELCDDREENPEALRDALTEAAKEFSDGAYLYQGDDGATYVDGIACRAGV